LLDFSKKEVIYPVHSKNPRKQSANPTANTVAQIINDPWLLVDISANPAPPKTTITMPNAWLLAPLISAPLS